jgi:hypothetical protein
MPDSAPSGREVGAADLALILEGIDVSQAKRTKRYRRKEICQTSRAAAS